MATPRTRFVSRKDGAWPSRPQGSRCGLRPTGQRTQTNNGMQVEVRWCGDQHLALLIGEAVNLETVLRVVDLNRRLLDSQLAPLIVETVPTWCSILVHFEVEEVRPRDFARLLDQFVAGLIQTETLQIPSRLRCVADPAPGGLAPEAEERRPRRVRHDRAVGARRHLRLSDRGVDVDGRPLLPLSDGRVQGPQSGAQHDDSGPRPRAMPGS